MIELKNIHKIYKAKKTKETVALKNINLKFANTGLVFIVGKSGCGKSTLLNILGGLDSATSGEILLNKRNLNDFREKEYDFYRNNYVGFVFQEFNILEEYNVYENIELALKLQNKIVDSQLILDLLKKLGLQGLENRNINELSGGQKQRVAIARALIKKPHLILADEPTGNLDSEASRQILEILKKISENTLVIVVSHDKEAASIYADRIIEISDGEVISDTNPPLSLNNADNMNFTSSSLPFKYTLKMAFRNLKIKPFKTFLTIAITTFSLIFMALILDAYFFKENLLVAQTVINNNINYHHIYKVNYNNLNLSTNRINLNNTDLENLNKDLNITLNPVYLFDNGNDYLKFEFGPFNDSQPLSSFYQNLFSPFLFVDVKDDNLWSNLIGSKPQNPNEIVVNRYFAEYIMKYGIMDVTGNLYFPESYDDLVNSHKKIKLGLNEVIIVGIRKEAHDDIYMEVKTKPDLLEDGNFKNAFQTDFLEQAYYIYTLDFANNVKLEDNTELLLKKLSLASLRYDGFIRYPSKNKLLTTENIAVITKNGLKNYNYLKDNEIILSYANLKEYDSAIEANYQEYLKDNNFEDNNINLSNYLQKYLQEDLSFSLGFNKLYYPLVTKDLEVVGINIQDENNYLSTELKELDIANNKTITETLVYDHNFNHLKKTFNSLEFNDSLPTKNLPSQDYYTYSLNNNGNLSVVAIIYQLLNKYSLIASLIITFFVFLIFCNFIGMTVNYCKKKIGILRSLGANKHDIIKIFLYEALFVSLISFILSLILWLILSTLINNSLFHEAYLKINIILNNPLIAFLVFIYIIFLTFIITLSLVKKITKIKPIEAILNK